MNFSVPIDPTVAGTGSPGAVKVTLAGGTVTAIPSMANVATRSQPVVATSPVSTLTAQDTSGNRRMVSIFNAGPNSLFVGLGTVDVSTTNYSVAITNQAYYEIDFVGRVTAITSTGTATAIVTVMDRT